MKKIQFTEQELKNIEGKFDYKKTLKLIFGYTYVDIIEMLPLLWSVEKRNNTWFIFNDFCRIEKNLSKDLQNKLDRLNELSRAIKSK